MTFLGLEQPVAYGRLLVFDPTTALMVLNANRDYINAVYRDYQLAMADMKEFNEKYGDFTSPILADVDWYYNNVTGRVKNFINDLYARGIDPLRSQEGRAAIARELATMPTKGIADRRQAAEIAKEYIKNAGLLSAKGKYNPDAEKFLGRDLSTWDTGVNGIWQYSSPIEMDPLKTLTESSYNNRTAHELTKADVEGFGVKYDPNAKYTGFTQNDLLNIANSIAPGLYGTPLMNWYRELARRKVQASGEEVNDENINAQLARDIANSQQEYLIEPTADYTDYYKRQEIGLRAAANLLARDKFNWEKQKYQQEHPESTEDGTRKRNPEDFSIAERWINKAMANAWSKDGITKNWMDMPDLYGDFGNNVDKVFHDYGEHYRHNASMGDLVNFALSQGASLNEALGAKIISELPKNKRTRELLIALDNFNKKWKKQYYDNFVGNTISSYERDFSIPMAAEDVVKAIGTPMSGNSRVALITDSNINKIYSVEDVVTGTAGYTKRHRTEKTQEIRDKIKEYGSDKVTVTPLETGYGSLRKSTGAFDVMPKVRIKITDDKGNIVYEADAYHKIADFTESTPGGAYLKDYKEAGGTVQYGTPGSHWNQDTNTFVPNDVRFQWRPSFSTRRFNMYPSYNNWLSYGGWDTEISKDNYNAGSPGKSAAW